MNCRLAKFISNAGICSRRDAEILITSGKVQVNNNIIINPATNVNEHDQIAVNNKIIKLTSQPRLWIYYKPIGLITTNKDPSNRPTIFQYLQKLPRVISVGRLDINSEGLLLLTNNGDLSRKLELPSSNIKRIYKVRAYGNINKILPYINNKKAFSLAIKGINYNINQIVAVEQLTNNISNNWFEISLTEGKNREVRKIFEYFSLTVNKLIRIQYGNFLLGNLKPGEYIEQHIMNFQHYLA